MTTSASTSPILSTMLVLLGTTAFAAAPPTGAGRLEGTWLFDSAMVKGNSQVGRVWTSKLTIEGDRFVLSKFMRLPVDLKGKLTLDPAASPKTIDLILEACDLSSYGLPVKIPVCTLSGIYRLDGDRLTVLFPYELDVKRPTGFDSTDDRLALTTLVKAPSRFKDFPDTVKVKVTGPDGKPAVGATLARLMYIPSTFEKPAAPKKWEYDDAVKTGADGTVTMKYTALLPHVVARDHQARRMAVVPLSPAGLAKGELNIRLESECLVKGSFVCEELRKLGRSVGRVHVYAMREGCRFGSLDAWESKFEMHLPPGKYRFYGYAAETGTRYFEVTVPAGKSELTLDPIALPVATLTLLKGKPAPELKDVVGWKGQAVKLTDLKGKYVLLDFWGYWCGPCIQAMPVLIELHEKFSDKGLAIIGIHRDAGGEVDTAAKLDEKTAALMKYWGGKNLPFPNALVSGKSRGTGKAEAGPVADYGVQAFPTTILIDPEGKVVGEFSAHDAKAAVNEVEKLLAKRKK